MSLIKCGSDEQGEYIEISRPKGEVPVCFIDENGVVHDTIRIYQYKAYRGNPVNMDLCVMCGRYVPEGTIVCKFCREAVEGHE